MCSSLLRFHSPGVFLDDGVFTIMVVRSCTRYELLHLLLVLDDGGHFQHPNVEIYKAFAYRLEPTLQASGENG